MNSETRQATIPAVSADGTTHIVTISRTPEGRISIIAHVCLCVLTYDRHQLLLAIRSLAEEPGGKAESGKAESGELRSALAAFGRNPYAGEMVELAEVLVEHIERLEARTAQPPN